MTRPDFVESGGAHDERCECDPAGFYLCHCSKRRREARGLTKPPTEPLYFPPPRCTACDEALYHDGDTLRCDNCALSWPEPAHMSEPRFIDDFGDIDEHKRKWQRANRRVEVLRAN